MFLKPTWENKFQTLRTGSLTGSGSLSFADPWGGLANRVRPMIPVPATNTFFLLRCFGKTVRVRGISPPAVARSGTMEAPGHAKNVFLRKVLLLRRFIVGELLLLKYKKILDSALEMDRRIPPGKHSDPKRTCPVRIHQLAGGSRGQPLALYCLKNWENFFVSLS